VPTSSNTINFDQFKHQISNSRPRRRRCSTWNHTSTIPIEESEDGANAEHLVKGEALVCVSKDGSTLMANVVNQNCDGGIFKISGSPCDIKSQSIPIRLTSTGSESTDSSSVSPGLLSPPLNSPRIKELKYMESSRTRRSPSVSVSSDESDLAESLNNFDLGDEESYEEDELQNKQIEYFNVSVHDMDTGLIHNLDTVKCIQIRQDRHKKSRDDVCQLSLPSDNLKFFSCKRLHGAKADLALNTHWGTKHRDLSFNVYKGEMAFTFKFPVFYPKSSVNETGWCL